MKLLRNLTLGYVTVLILALASSLVAIWINLRRIAGTLGDVHQQLASVRDETESLGEPLEQLRDVTVASAGAMTEAQQALERASDRLAAFAEERGTARPVR